MRKFLVFLVFGVLVFSSLPTTSVGQAGQSSGVTVTVSDQNPSPLWDFWKQNATALSGRFAGYVKKDANGKLAETNQYFANAVIHAQANSDLVAKVRNRPCAGRGIYKCLYTGDEINLNVSYHTQNLGNSTPQQSEDNRTEVKYNLPENNRETQKTNRTNKNQENLVFNGFRKKQGRQGDFTMQLKGTLKMITRQDSTIKSLQDSIEILRDSLTKTSRLLGEQNSAESGASPSSSKRDMKAATELNVNEDSSPLTRAWNSTTLWYMVIFTLCVALFFYVYTPPKKKKMRKLTREVERYLYGDRK